MLWYKLKTWYGGEEALVKEIKRTVPPYLYEDVFVIYNERDIRRQERVLVEQKPLFRGCVFLTCKDTGTESLFHRMEKIPAIWRLIATGYLTMFPLMEKDAEFLEAISGEDHVVRASYVLREWNEGGQPGNTARDVTQDVAQAYVSQGRADSDTADSTYYRIYGPLEYLLDGIEKIRFSSRFAKTHKKLWGEDTVIPLGILLDVDVNADTFYNRTQKVLESTTAIYDGTKTVTATPSADHYTVLEVRKDETGKNHYRVRGSVTVIPGGEEIGETEFGKKRVGEPESTGEPRPTSEFRKEQAKNLKIGMAVSHK